MKTLLNLVLFRERRTLRQVEFRIDRYGIYLLFSQEGYLVAGVSYQYPEFLTKNQHLVPGLSVWSWDAQDRIAFWKDREQELATYGDWSEV